MEHIVKHRIEIAQNIQKSYSNTETIRKGEIADRLASGYGSGSKALTFTKTGKEIKDKLPSIETSLTSAKQVILAELGALKIKVGVEPTEAYSSKKFNLLRYPYKLTECTYDPIGQCYLDRSETSTCAAKYNDLCWQLLDIETDLEAIKVMTTNLDDEKKYDLSVSQLVALEFNN